MVGGFQIFAELGLRFRRVQRCEERGVNRWVRVWGWKLCRALNGGAQCSQAGRGINADPAPPSLGLNQRLQRLPPSARKPDEGLPLVLRNSGLADGAPRMRVWAAVVCTEALVRRRNAVQQVMGFIDNIGRDARRTFQRDVVNCGG